MQPAILAAVLLFLAIVVPVVLWRFRRTSSTATTIVTRVVDRAAQEQAKALQQQREERAAAVAAGKILQDGRPRCQASPSCTDAATRHRPLVMRDDGWFDLVRRFFGAPDRLRLDTYVAPMFLHAWEVFWAGLFDTKLSVPVVPEFCEEHVHLAWEEGRAELADIEYGRVKASRDDQARLAYFAKVGLMERVASRIAQVEAEEKRAKRGGRRSAVSVPGNVTPIRAAVGDK